MLGGGDQAPPALRAGHPADRHLLLAGYRTTRVTHQMLDQETEELAADLRRLLSEPA